MDLTNLIPSLTPEHIMLLFFGWYIWKSVKKGQEDAKKDVEKSHDERIKSAKEAIKESLGNGIGDLVRRLNSEQDMRWQALIDRAFSEHERREEKNVAAAIEAQRASNRETCDHIVRSFEDHDRRLQSIEYRIEDHLGMTPRKVASRRK